MGKFTAQDIQNYFNSRYSLEDMKESLDKVEEYFENSNERLFNKSKYFDLLNNTGRTIYSLKKHGYLPLAGDGLYWELKKTTTSQDLFLIINKIIKKNGCSCLWLDSGNQHVNMKLKIFENEDDLDDWLMMYEDKEIEFGAIEDFMVEDDIADVLMSKNTNNISQKHNFVC